MLRRRKDSEKDLIVSFLSETGMVYNLRLHGLLATSRRSALSAEPGCLVKYIFYFDNTKDIYSVKEASLIERFDNIKSDYKNMYLLSALLEMSEKGAKHSEKEDGIEIHSLLEKALHHLEDNCSSITFVQNIRLLFYLFFSLRILSILGLSGDLDHCSLCGEELAQDAFWNLPELDFHCRSCESRADPAGGKMRKIVKLALMHKFSIFMKKAAEEGLLEPQFYDLFKNSMKHCIYQQFSGLNALDELYKMN